MKIRYKEPVRIIKDMVIESDNGNIRCGPGPSMTVIFKVICVTLGIKTHFNEFAE